MDAVGLIDVGRPAGLNLNVDRVGITYSNGQSLGDPSSPVQRSCSLVGDRPVPSRAIPEVRTRVAVHLDPIDVTDAEDVRWLRACLGPDQREPMARLEAELRLAATALPCCSGVTRSTCCPKPSPGCPQPPCRSSSRRGRCRASRPSVACASCTVLRKLQPAARWRGCRWKGLESRPRFQPLAIVVPQATASSAWRCSAGRCPAPRPLAVAGHGPRTDLAGRLLEAAFSQARCLPRQQSVD